MIIIARLNASARLMIVSDLEHTMVGCIIVWSTIGVVYYIGVEFPKLNLHSLGRNFPNYTMVVIVFDWLIC